MSIIDMEKQVFIRREGDSWVIARKHHKAAFDIFLIDETKSRVLTPHGDGGYFVAYFSKVGDVYKYVDEYDRTVEIAYMIPNNPVSNPVSIN